MMKRLKTICVIAMFVLPTGVMAQLYPLGSQYIFNDYLVNPAVTGSKAYNPIRIGYKKLLTGFNDGPVTQYVSYHSLISGPPNHETMGIGGSIQYNTFGMHNKMRAQLSYAFHADIKRKTNKLAIGFSLSAINESIDQLRLNVVTPDDPEITAATSGKLEPNATFGMYFYSARFGNQAYRYDTYSIGLVAANLLGSADTITGTQFSFNTEDNTRHFYLHGAYGYRMKNSMLEPAAMIRFSENGGMSFDVHAKMYYNYMETGNVWGGLGLRTGDAFAILIGFTHQNITLGYSYDIIFGEINNYAGATHDLHLGILLNRRTIKTL